MTTERKTAGDLFVESLQRHGIDYLFANGGTDFGPVIEAFARCQELGLDAPTPLAIPHETAAVAMAHGYYLATGRAQAVMVHTNVGLANVVMGAINAAAEQIPMLICSGKTPITETGHLGSRSTPINWGQDMRDQAALMRESVKWDSELRYPEQMAALVDRAMSIAGSSPTGPVYLSLPREALCATVEPGQGTSSSLAAPARAAPDGRAVKEAAEILSVAKTPLIICHRCDRTAAENGTLQLFAEKFAIPVVEYWHARSAIASDSPMHAGFNPGEDLARADAVLVLDALVPWIPEVHKPAEGCRVIQAGPDPLHARFPIRGFPADISITGEVSAVLEALGAEIRMDATTVSRRAEELEVRHAARREAALERARSAAKAPASPDWVSYCISEVLGDGMIFNEIGVRAASMQVTRPGSYFAHAASGGLGWALPTALGAQLADRERLVVATMGDGSYIFANPVACHQIAEAHELPILTVVFNNGQWNAVRRSALDIAPDGYAARANRMPLTSLEPSPDFRKVAEASRAHALRVEDGTDLPAALEEAVGVIRKDKRQVLLDVATGTD